MKQKIFALLALVMTAMTASAVETPTYSLTKADGAEAHGTIAFTVGDNTNATEAAEGQTVTVTVTYEEGWGVNKISGQWIAAVAASRRLLRGGGGGGGDVGMLSSFELTPASVNSWTFTMERADAEISVEYAGTLITISAASEEWVYDGTTHKNPAVTVTEGSLLEGDDLVAEAKGSVKNVADTREGNNTVKTGYKVMRGTIDVTSNYTITVEDGTLTVTPRPVTVSGIVVRTRNYDGTTAVNLSFAKAVLEGKVEGEELGVTGTGNFEDPNAGKDKTVYLDELTLTGADKDNYMFSEDSQQEAKGQISKRPLTVTAKDKTISYGDEPANNGVRYLGFVTGEDVSVVNGELRYSYNTAENGSGTAYKAGSPVGSYYIIPGGLRCDNYELNYKTGTLTVTEKAYSYDGGTVTEDQDGYDVSLDEGTGSAKPLPLGKDGELDELDYSRTLKAPGEGKGDKTVDDEAVNLYTVCLPFEPVTDEGVKYYTLGSVEGTVLDFEEVETPAAGTPYLVAVTGSTNITESCTDLDVTSMAISSTTVGGYTLKGTYSGLSNEEAQGLYILQNKGQWGMVTAANAKAYLPPFRAYIEGPADGARELGSSFGGESTGVTTLRTVDLDGTEHWYDLQGRRIAAPAKKGIFIYNGKKVTK